MNTVHTEQRSGTARSPVSSVRHLPSGLASHLCPLRSRNSSGRRRLSLSPCPARAPLLGGGAGAVGGARAVNGALGRRRGTSSRNFLRLGQLLGGLEERQPRRRPTQGTISLAGATSSRPRRATGRRRAKCGGLSDHWDEAPYPPRGSLLLTGPPHTDPWTFLSPPSVTQGYRSTTSYCRQ